MTLWNWMAVHHPDRGGTSWLMRMSGVSFPTIRKALSGQAIADKSAAEKLSAATGGEVSVGEIMCPPKRKDGRAFLENTARKRTVSP